MTTPASLPAPFIPLDSPHADLPRVGGKACNLSILARAGLPVPNAFFIPVEMYRDFVRANRLDEVIRAALDGLPPEDPAALEAASQKIRTAFAGGAFSPGFVSALEIAWRWLGAPPAAVRSSATAEDLPGLSFAGQQDTYLNIIGVEALTGAVRDCWASLWTARAIGYRARNDIPQDQVALAVIVQKMVQSEASGVMFTANPLTGRRAEVVIDAALGLGEALVSGLVEPDHYVVDSLGSRITHKIRGSKSVVIRGNPAGGVSTQKTESAQVQAIPDETILELAALGKKIEALYNFPQDIEWSYLASPGGRGAGGEGKIHILQSRPITSLYPLPEALPAEPLRLLMGLHLVQGVMEPFTPLGQDTLKLVLTSGGRVFGLRYTIESQTAFYTAGERLWINITPILRSPLGRKIYPRAIAAIDPPLAQIVAQLLDSEPRLAAVEARPGWRAVWRLVRFGLPFAGRVLGALLRPEHTARRTLAAFDAAVAAAGSRLQPQGDRGQRFAARLALLQETAALFPARIIPLGLPPIVGGMASFFGILARFAGEAAEAHGDERLRSLHLEIARGLPNNVTTGMDLDLWQKALALRADPAAAQAFANTPAPALAAAYRQGDLPPAAQGTLDDFLAKYGARGLGEIDLGRPRWREDPRHVIQSLQSYLPIDDPQQAPDAVFARGALAAARAVDDLAAAVRALPGGWLKSRLVRVAARRYRALGGLREAPKFFAIRMLGLLREGLLASGRDFVKAGLLAQEDDLFFLHLAELEEIAARGEISAALREKIAARRAARAREMRRRQIPRVLLSDGTAFYEGITAPEGESDALLGDPVSPGVAEGAVRVVFDPHRTRLQPGEILVCPGTDPAWTPLFLAAGGLVMEVGGMMTHGSVVAREYGIPAVVGVHQATARLKTGQRVRVDGSSGKIEVLAD
ncbi:MAG: phosphoenolpyruvate synthase [Anaerolineales bacterium]